MRQLQQLTLFLMLTLMASLTTSSRVIFLRLRAAAMCKDVSPFCCHDNPAAAAQRYYHDTNMQNALAFLYCEIVHDVDRRKNTTYTEEKVRKWRMKCSKNYEQLNSTILIRYYTNFFTFFTKPLARIHKLSINSILWVHDICSLHLIKELLKLGGQEGVPLNSCHDSTK